MSHAENSHAAAFFRLFREQWARGGWDWPRFSRAMAAAGVPSLDYKTCMPWLSPTRHPKRGVTETNKNAILKVFFPAADCEHYLAMKNAWEATRGLLPPEAVPEPPSRGAGDAWEFLGEPFSMEPRLVDLSLQPPLAANRQEGEAEGYRIHIALRLGHAVEFEVDNKAVLVSLREPTLSLSAPGYRVVEGSQLGGKERESAHLRLVAGGWQVQANEANAGEELTEGKTLATIQGQGKAGELAVTLSTTRLRVQLAEESANRDAIIDAIFKSVLPKEGGAMVLARDRMRRKPEEPET
jgi:hypothetical protein